MLSQSLHIVLKQRKSCLILNSNKRGLTSRSPAQFERILAEVLRITKNLKGGDWVAIEYHTQKRKRQGLDTIVYINDEPQNAKKLAKQANRYRNRVPENGGKLFQEFIDKAISRFCCVRY